MALGVSTYRIDVRIAPGEIYEEEIVLWNSSEVALRIDVERAGLRLDRDGNLLWLDECGTDAHGDRHGYADLASAVEVEPVSLIIPGGGEGVFRVRIGESVGADVQVLGGCAGALRFTATPESAINDDPLFVNVFQLITFVLVRFGDARAGVDVAGFDANASSDSTIGVSLDLVNNGSAHTTPAVSFRLVRQDTGEIAQDMQVPEGTLLPDSIRAYRGVFSDVPPGRYKVRYEVTYPESANERLTGEQEQEIVIQHR